MLFPAVARLVDLSYEIISTDIWQNIGGRIVRVSVAEPRE
jgi:hypothetical protein